MSLQAPFPYMGGKSQIAEAIWERLGADTVSYVEPFAGSLAVLLGRPNWSPEAGYVETVNDMDGLLCNAWRGILHDPEATAYAADWPASECDLASRHAYLVEQRPALTERLMGDPDYFDAKLAGWWVWGASIWIGGGFCSGEGPWRRVEVAPGDWRMLKTSSQDGKGVKRQRPHLGNKGAGIQRQLPHLGNKGRGVQRKSVGADGLLGWFEALSERLRRVRVCCGDWSRVVTPAAAFAYNTTSVAVFLDPPYSAAANRDAAIYASDDLEVAHKVRAWCLTAPPTWRIALCGYEGEGHEPLQAAGWSTLAWTAKGGYANQGENQGRINRGRETVWFSPACAPQRQTTLLL